jgi:cytochrome c
MKRVVFSFLFASLLLTSCSKKEEQSSLGGEPVAATPVEKPASSDHQGRVLMDASDCMSCHKNDQKFIGPSYQEIADKYSDRDLELLASKIIDGGSGVWGNVPMQAHPNVSKEEAKQMVLYILTLKK